MLEGIDQMANNSDVLQEINVYPVRFWADHVSVDGDLVEVHRVELVKKGSTDTTPWKIAHLKKNEIIWPHVKDAYERWVEGQEEPEDGTPLSVCAFLPPAQVEQLKLYHIRSVEDLAATTDADGERLGMNWRSIRDKARAFVESKKGHAVVAEAMAERDATIHSMGEEMADMRTVMEAMSAQLAALAPKETDPPKKPAKAKAAAGG